MQTSTNVDAVTRFASIPNVLWSSARTCALVASVLLAACGGNDGKSADVASTATATPVRSASAAATVKATYQASDEDFANPERGFAYENDVPWAPVVTWDFCGQGNNYTAYNYTAWNDPLNEDFLKEERRQGRSVVTSRYHIADFRNRDLTPDYLAFLQRDFDAVRQTGMKVHLRFSYNYPFGGPDAPLDRIFGHLDQLKPLLEQNVDVIAYVDAAFIGCWGEWHHSSNGLAIDTGGITQAQKSLMDKWLAVLPPQRMVAMRYPYHKFGYLGSADFKPVAPLTIDTAFNGSNRSRVASEDDCPVCSDSHGAGFWNPRGDLTEAPTFMRQENLFVVQGGEPGDPESIDPTQPANPNSPLSACPRVIETFKNLRWSVMGLYNLGSPASAIQRWERDGCLEEIKKSLGYRYRLASSEIPSTAQAGSALLLKFDLANDGWANLYNPRIMEMVLRHKGSGDLVPLPVHADARAQMPFPASTKTFELTLTLPANTAPGDYDVLMHLADPAPTLYGRPEYAIRLANQDTWEPQTGFNKLSGQISVVR
jgi:hypothetical protein